MTARSVHALSVQGKPFPQCTTHTAAAFRPLVTGSPSLVRATMPLVTNSWRHHPDAAQIGANGASAVNGGGMSHPLRFPIAIASLCVALVTSFGAPATARAANTPADEAARTDSAVIAVDDHWLEAEVSGDTAWLDAMLMPDYRSISPEGKVLDKPRLLANAVKNRGSDTMRRKVDAWIKTHPTRKAVVMHGDVAILSFSDPQTGRVRSSDIFVYKDGGWHALYSQHAKVE